MRKFYSTPDSDEYEDDLLQITTQEVLIDKLSIEEQLALNRARGNITDQVARYNRINLFYKQFQASVRISYKNVP